MQQCCAAERKVQLHVVFLANAEVISSTVPVLVVSLVRHCFYIAFIMDVSPLSSPQMRTDKDERRSSFQDRTLPALPLLSRTSTATMNALGTSLIKKYPTVPVWPEQPQAIQRGGWLSWVAFLGDTLVALTSTAFIIFGSLVLHFDGVPTSEVSPLSVLNQLTILSNASRIVGFFLTVSCLKSLNVSIMHHEI
jgi:hypothetical protein